MINYQDKLKEKREAERVERLSRQRHNEVVKAAKDSATTVAAEIARQHSKDRTTTSKVEVINQPTLEVEHQTDFTPVLYALREVERAIKATKKQPDINVSAPEVDLKPLTKAIKSINTETGINLDNFRAQDIDEAEIDVQYVGLVNPDGVWMIIKNDIKGNNLRYAMGLNGYAKAFTLLPTHKYTTLDEAMNALQA